MEKKKTTVINWNEVFNNAKVLDAYRRFSSGASSVKEVQAEFRNTAHITLFNKLIRRGGVAKARESVRSALRRRNLT